MYLFKLVNLRMDLYGVYSMENLIKWYNDYFKKNVVEVEDVIKDLSNDSDFKVVYLGFFDCVEI